MLVQRHASWVMAIWVPLLVGTITLACILIELRVGVQYVADVFDVKWALPDPQLCKKEQSSFP
jgi:hypothetical protein